MRHIDIERLKKIYGEDKLKEWEAKGKNYVSQLKGMTKDERRIFFTKNNDWTELYVAMSALSYHKCWYSEAPDNSNSWEVDHFRPKGKAINHDKEVTLAEGYWWLAYDWRNYRLAGTLVNKRQKDKFNTSDEVLGKGIYFPIDLDNCKALELDGDLEDEIVVLLDPTVFYDTTLLSFDENGEPIATAAPNTFEYFRAITSIDLLSLKHSVLNRHRKQIWDNCERAILEAQNKFKKTQNPQLRQSKLTSSFEIIRKTAMPDSPYSSVARGCIKVYSKKPDFEWLVNVLESL